MKSTAVTLVALALASAAPARAQDARDIVITRAASRPSRAAPAEYFTGTARVQPLFDTTATSHVYGASVSFDAGARTAWHTHARGQLLIVTEGVGRVQRWGGPVDEIRPGDVVRIPPGAKHWHGASPTAAMTHIAIVEHGGGSTTDWMEKVSAAQYDARPDAPGAAAVSAERGVAGDNARPSRAQQLMGDIAPKLAQLTDSVLYDARTVLPVGVRVLRSTRTFRSLRHEQYEQGTGTARALPREVALDVGAKSGYPGRSLP